MIHHTVNDTTSTVGQSIATVIADTMSPEGNRITTFELVYPRYIHCFDEKTEILAIVGNDAPKFMSFPKAKELGVRVAQYDNGKISFVEPAEWIENRGTHRMVKYEDRKASMCVTDGHRVFVHKRTTGNAFVPETWTANQLLGDYICFRIPQSGSFESGQRFSKEELALMVWFACDGTKQNNRICFHFRKQRKIDAIERLLSALRIDYVKRCYEDSTCVWCDAPAWVSDCYTDDGEKKLPEQGMFMDNESYQFVKQAILESDGCVVNQEFNSASKTLAEQVQVLAHLHDDSMNLRFFGRDNRSLYKSCFKTTNYISFRRDKDKFEECFIDGAVYCVSVPSSYVVVRRDGIVFVSGNCELMTHRVMSRNASSSRATPLTVTLDEVRNDPVGFDYVGKNQRGMVAGDELTDEELKGFNELWRDLGCNVARCVEYMSKEYGIHKQTLNRALEPWLRIRTLVTATDWDNFFTLRLAEDAQPEIRSLALAMKEAMEKSEPVASDVHLPYIKEGDDVASAVARCARVSYARHDGKETSVEADRALYQQLLEGGHYSPFEHVAYARAGRWANFDGWRSLRNVMGR